MHRYQPKIHIVEIDDSVYGLKPPCLKTVAFDETAFFAVTAYQNENVSTL